VVGVAPLLTVRSSGGLVVTAPVELWVGAIIEMLPLDVRQQLLARVQDRIRNNVTIARPDGTVVSSEKEVT
jgi:hypothetical protein